MATFKFDHDIDIHWNGYEIVGPAETVFSIPDQLYEEFESDLRSVEPSLTWIDTNEFLTLSNSVSVTGLSGEIPISITSTTSGKLISITSGTASSGYLLTADGVGGVAFSPAAETGSAQTLRTYVKNASGSTITKGQAVYVSGADGTNALIDIASASNELTSSKTLGIVASTLTNNAFGYVIENGQLSNIDTSGTTAGASVWLGDTPGSLVFGAPPAEPSNSVYLGVVTKANASTGEILVKVQNGYELDELHDVSAGSPTDLDILQYKNSSGMWTKTGITSAGIVTTSDTQTLTNKTITLPSIANTKGNYATTVSTVSTTTVLTASSPYYQYVTGTGSSTYRIQLPDTSTLTVGHSYEIHNNSSNTLGILTSLGTSVLTLINNFSYRITCIDTSTNSTSSWNLEAVGAGTTTGSGSLVFGTSPTLTTPSVSGGITGMSFIRTSGWTSIATAAGTTTISTTANQNIKFTGTNTQFANLSGSGSSGLEYRIYNTSTGDVTVRSSDLSTVVVLKQNQAVRVMLNTTSGTTASVWDVQWLGASTATGTGSSVYSASPTFTGDVTLNAQGDIRFADSDSSNWVALQGASSIASNVTWTLPSADGTSGQALTTNGVGALSWATVSGATISSFTSNGTYTVPTGASLVYVYAVGGGAGGQGGAETNAGFGGSPGNVAWRYFRAIDLASSTYAVTIASGGTTAVGTSTSTLGVSNAGGDTTFGSLLTANGGPGKASGTSGSSNTIGRILVASDTSGNSKPDGEVNSRGSASVNALLGPAGGGSGASNATGAGNAGGAGFGRASLTTTGSGGAGGAGSSGGTPSAGTSATGFGDGGGAGGSTTSTTVAGGNGGNGAFPGGGGGAGGATGTGSSANGGTGGAGGDGWCLVVSW